MNPDTSEVAMPPAFVLRFRKILILLAHVVAFSASLMLSFLLTKNMQFSREWLVEQYPALVLFCLVIKLVIFGLFKQYRGWWRYVGISDLLGIVRASLVSTMAVMVLWYTLVLILPNSIRESLQNVDDVGQGVLMADMFFTILLLGGLRMVIRLYYEEFRTVEGLRLKRFLIVGAGNAGVRGLICRPE